MFHILISLIVFLFRRYSDLLLVAMSDNESYEDACDDLPHSQEESSFSVDSPVDSSLTAMGNTDNIYNERLTNEDEQINSAGECTENGKENLSDAIDEDFLKEQEARMTDEEKQVNKSFLLPFFSHQDVNLYSQSRFLY